MMKFFGSFEGKEKKYAKGDIILDMFDISVPEKDRIIGLHGLLSNSKVYIHPYSGNKRLGEFVGYSYFNRAIFWKYDFDFASRKFKKVTFRAAITDDDVETMSKLAKSITRIKIVLKDKTTNDLIGTFATIKLDDKIVLADFTDNFIKASLDVFKEE